MNLALVLLVAVPLVAGMGLVVVGSRANRWAPGVGVGAGGVAVGLAVVVAVGRPAVSVPFLAGIRAGIAVDGLSAVMVLTVTAITLAVVVYAAGELTRREARARFFGLMLIFAAAMLLTVTATDLVV
ncbi:MAG: NADH-quinone oxidoreductase subunit L, partial [Mycobacteriaceae bacterium]